MNPARTHALLAGCLLTATTACSPPHAAPNAPPYTPRSRDLTVTTVPLLVKEQQSLFPFLKDAFAKGGVLDGKEVYAFSPSTFTVVEGDTIHFRLINPEDDDHSFVLPDFAVALAGGTEVDTTYVARRAGIFPIVCAVPSHLPMMSGQLVVLPAATMAGAGGP
ncbi:MAG: cupredoxin domain-containing protein [Gemmatimonadetes bacterium]|nr:cupredoxin domain-containing protein [Gemmatimonadota bacterium]